MKNLFALLLGLLLSLPATLSASHLMGGEITWRCDGSGNYIFTAKLYRDCNGIPGPASIALTTNAPVFLINLIKVNQTDISPVGPGCPTCSIPAGFANAVEEFIYESQPINLAGSPPVSGWYFSYSDCCRNGAISNLGSSGSGYFALRAMMYPHSGATAGLCSDNSPQFAEPPSLAMCKSDTVYFANAALDQDLDSLIYDWGSPLDGATWPFSNYPFNPGYSISSPLPSSLQNPANVAANLDPASGIITFYSETSGAFVTVTKISSYKCGQLVSEIFREVQVVLIDCPINSGPNSNHGPVFSPNNLPVFISVLAGDTVSFPIQISDFELLSGSPPSFQSITLSSNGLAFGDGDTSSTSGCMIPPCATLNNTSPYSSGSSILNESFNWVTACAHAGFNNGCLQHVRAFHFVFKATDNFCPANGVRYKNVIVNVSGPTVYQIGNDLVVSYPGVTVQWYLNGVPIPGATDTIITPTQSGIYTVLATTGSGCQMISNPVLRTFSGDEEIENESSFSVFPNPLAAGQQVQLLVKNFTIGQQVINITDVTGKLVKSYTIHLHEPTEHLAFDLSGIQAGLYHIVISNASGVYQNKFMIK